MFKLGQKVVCKDDSNQRLSDNFYIKGGQSLDNVIKGKIYVIRYIHSNGGLLLENVIAGYHWNGEEVVFNENRFEPLQYDLISNKEIIKNIITEKSDIPIKEKETVMN